MEASKPRILFVDDDGDCAALGEAPALASQYEFKLAATPEEAIALARRERFDLYLIDHRYPHGIGVALCRQLRSFDRRTPILICSAEFQEAHRLEVLRAGADGYLAKPVDPVGIQKAIARLLDPPKPMAAGAAVAYSGWSRPAAPDQMLVA